MRTKMREASLGQVFSCLQEVENAFNPFAVSVMRDSDIIGHVPRKISAACSLSKRASSCLFILQRIPVVIPMTTLVPIVTRFSWMTSNHEIHKNLNPSKQNTLTVYQKF